MTPASTSPDCPRSRAPESRYPSGAGTRRRRPRPCSRPSGPRPAASAGPASRAALQRASSSSASGSFAARACRRPNSPGCGVRTSRSRHDRHQRLSSASALSASASMTAGRRSRGEEGARAALRGGLTAQARTDDDRVVGGCLGGDAPPAAGRDQAGRLLVEQQHVSSGTRPSSAHADRLRASPRRRGPPPCAHAPRPASRPRRRTRASRPRRAPCRRCPCARAPAAPAGAAATQRWVGRCPGTDTTGGRRCATATATAMLALVQIETVTSSRSEASARSCGPRRGA